MPQVVPAPLLDASRAQALLGLRQRLLAPFLRSAPGTHLLLLERSDLDAGALRMPPTSLGHASSLRLADGCWSGNVQAHAYELPFADESMAIVAVSHVFEALPDAVALAAELTRVLQPGARMLICGLRHWHPQALGLRYRVRRAGGECLLRTPHALQRLLGAHGFQRELLQRAGACYVLVLRKPRASARIIHLARVRPAHFSGRVPALPGQTRRTRR